MVTDVFIIGGGPVGLAAAIAARRKGLSVTVADALRPPIDKACGEGLLPWGLAAAERLGIRIPESQSYPLRGIRFCGSGSSVEADFPQVPGRGVRRTVLHAAMVEAAASTGVDLQWGRSAQSLSEIPARWIVGADGAASRVRRWAGLESCSRDSRRYGYRVHYPVAPWSEYVEVHWGEGCQLYVTPVAPGEVGVALISRDSKLRVEAALERFPSLATRLAGLRPCSRERGAVTFSRTLRRVASNNVALIGDASGSVDAITGEGLSLGFHQAFALADALEKGALTSYEDAHRRLGTRPRLMGDLLLTLDRAAWLRNRALTVLSARPDLFHAMLALHTGEARLQDALVPGAVLGWKMLRG